MQYQVDVRLIVEAENIGDVDTGALGQLIEMHSTEHGSALGAFTRIVRIETSRAHNVPGAGFTEPSFGDERSFGDG